MIQALQLFVILVCYLPRSSSTYSPWIPQNRNITDLLCEDGCLTDGQFDDGCCICHSKASWEIRNDTVTSLHLEYVTPSGINTLWSPIRGQQTDVQSLQRALHTDGYMSSFPLNLCEFPDIVEIDFSRNSIKAISNISCLGNLQKLNLQGNKITRLQNTTFTYNSMLRELDVSFNLLKEIDPNTFVTNGLAIKMINVSNTNLQKIDVTNFVLERPFCTVDYSNNPASQFTNINDFKIDNDKEYGENGKIRVDNCSLSSFLNLTDIGIVIPNQALKNLKFALTVEGLRIRCDCVFEPYLEADISSLQRFLPKIFEADLTCNSPEHLINQSVSKIIFQPQILDSLVCEHTFRCPHKCHCFEQPSKRHFVVNCTNAGLTSLPINIPWGKNYSLYLSGNLITELEERDYLARASVLDISTNPLSSISEAAVSLLPVDAKITARNTNLKSIPKSLQLKMPSSVILGTVYIECTCDNIWISDWVKIRQPKETDSKFLCKNKSNINIRYLNKNILECLSEKPYIKIVMIILAILSFILLTALMLFACCRPEIYIIYREKLRYRRNEKCETQFDVTVFMEENDEFQLQWARHSLLPFLERNNYSVYFPIRDEPFGMPKEACLQYEINNSRAYIFVVSESTFPKLTGKNTVNYIDEDCAASASQSFRFARLWAAYKRDKYRRIIVINFDNLNTSDIDNRIIRAFLRVTECINFTDRHGNILDKIKTKLGNPNQEYQKTNGVHTYRTDVSARPAFRRKFQVANDIPIYKLKFIETRFCNQTV